MKKHKLKLIEVLSLEVEIAGVVNQETGERVIEGLLSQKISMVTKYWLNTLLETLDKEKKKLASIREELIKKYGEEDKDGQIGIDPFLKTDQVDDAGNAVSVQNPKYIEFMTEYNNVLNESVEIKLPSIQLDDLKHIETSDNYPLVFKHLVIAPTVADEESSNDVG